MSAHCSSCGEPDPGHHEGYTACCNKRVCYGHEGTDEKDCCGAKSRGLVRP